MDPEVVGRGAPEGRTNPVVTWQVFGGVAARVDGRHVPLGPRAQRIVGSLLIRPDVPRSASQLADGVDDRAIGALRVAIKRVRDQFAALGVNDVIGRAGSGYVLDAPAESVDHLNYRRLVGEAAAATSAEHRFRRLDEARQLWVPPPFGELRFGEPFAGEADVLEELHRTTMDRWAEAGLECGLSDAILPVLRAAAEEEPLREDRWRHLMIAQYRAGQQADALRTYRRASTLLGELVGLEPGPDLRETERRVLLQDPALLGRPQRSAVRIGAGRAAAVLVGRDDEVSDIHELLERHRLVAVTGLGGIGKTAVAEEVARSTPMSNALIVRCGQAQSLRALLEAIGDAAEIATRSRATVELVAAVVDRLGASPTLLVLDACEHLVDEVVGLVSQLVDAVHDLRVLATSRVEIPVPGAVHVQLGALPIGTLDQPGPAALIVADAAGIMPSQLRRRWDDVNGVCQRAGGVPLSLGLLGAAMGAGVDAVDERDPISDAIATAIASLPESTIALVTSLAALPDGATDRFLAFIVDRPLNDVRRDLAAAVRAGLIDRRPSPAGHRSLVLDPVRHHVLAGVDERRAALDLVVSTLLELAARAVPSLARAPDLDLVALLDAENATTMWAVSDADDEEERFASAIALAPVWRASGRTVQVETVLDDLVQAAERIGDPGSDPQVGRFWVCRAAASPSLAARVPYAAALREVVEGVHVHGDRDLAGRAAGELAIALGWSGDVPGALASIVDARRLVDDPDPWGLTTVESLEAMGRGLSGDPAGAGRELVRLADVYDRIGSFEGDAYSNRFIGSFFLRVAGEDAALGELLRQVEQRPEPTGAGAYPWSALLFERARAAARSGELIAGPMLRRAADALARHGEHRTAAVARRELGSWLAAAGDAEGVGLLASSAAILVTADPPAAAVALAVLGSHVEEPVAGRLVASSLELLRSPGGVPLDATELARIDAVRHSASAPFGEAALRAALTRLAQVHTVGRAADNARPAV